MMWDIVYTSRAEKDVKKMKMSSSYNNLKKLVASMQVNPYTTSTPFEKLEGYDNVYSRRINIKHRLVYQVLKDELTIKVISLWGHYDDN